MGSTRDRIEVISYRLDVTDTVGYTKRTNPVVVHPAPTPRVAVRQIISGQLRSAVARRLQSSQQQGFAEGRGARGLQTSARRCHRGHISSELLNRPRTIARSLHLLHVHVEFKGVLLTLAFRVSSMHCVRVHPAKARVDAYHSISLIAHAIGASPPAPARAGQQVAAPAHGRWREAACLRLQPRCRTQHAAQRWRIQASADGVKRSPSPSVLQTWRRAHVRDRSGRHALSCNGVPNATYSLPACMAAARPLGNQAVIREQLGCADTEAARAETNPGTSIQHMHPAHRLSASTSTARARRRTPWTCSPTSWVSEGAEHLRPARGPEAHMNTCAVEDARSPYRSTPYRGDRQAGPRSLPVVSLSELHRCQRDPVVA